MLMYTFLLRKGVHSITAVLLAFIGISYGVTPVVAIGLILFGFFLLTRVHGALDVLHLVAKASYGELFLAAGVVCSALLFLTGGPDAFLGSILILAFADPLAALVGSHYGTREYKVFGERRTLEGSLVCFLVSALIIGLFGFTWYFALMGGLILAVVEALAPKGSDNLFLPLVAGLLLSFL
jgi:phytol kinase